MRIAAFTLLLLAWAGIAGDRPNIVLIMADDLGYETIGANGGTSYKTPNIDRMASEGVRFEHCYSQPLCTPSRVQLMTGQYNIRNYIDFGSLEQHQRTFAQTLRTAGYATAIAGKWQLNGNQKIADTPGEAYARHFGFDEWCLWQTTDSGRVKDAAGKRVDARYANPVLNTNGTLAGPLTDQYGPDRCADFVLDFISRHKDGPFMVYYPMILTHCPFWPTPNSPIWADPKKRMPGDSYKGDPKYFGDMVSYMDRNVGRVLDHLKELGLDDNTLVIFTGDNGTDVPIVSMCNGREVAGAKGHTTDGGTHVPLVVRWPKIAKGGRISQNLVDFTDFYPTLLETAGTPVPADLRLDGQSIVPLLRDPAAPGREWIYCWYSRNGSESGAKIFARNQRYKLYSNGFFFDISNDALEKSPLGPELPEAARETRKALQAAIDRLSKERGSSVPGGIR